MSTAAHEPARTVHERRRLSTQLLTRDMWTALAIVAIWLAVLFSAVFGPDIVTRSSGGDGATSPSAVLVALFAALATRAVARYGFGQQHREGD